MRPERIAVWPCDHGNVRVEPAPIPKGYRCAVCGAMASEYVLAELLDRRVIDKALGETDG